MAKILYEYILLDENDNFISNITPDRFDIYDAVNNSNINGINKNRVYNENVCFLYNSLFKDNFELLFDIIDRNNNSGKYRKFDICEVSKVLFAKKIDDNKKAKYFYKEYVSKKGLTLCYDIHPIIYKSDLLEQSQDNFISGEYLFDPKLSLKSMYNNLSVLSNRNNGNVEVNKDYADLQSDLFSKYNVTLALNTIRMNQNLPGTHLYSLLLNIISYLDKNNLISKDQVNQIKLLNNDIICLYSNVSSFNKEEFREKVLLLLKYLQENINFDSIDLDGPKIIIPEKVIYDELLDQIDKQIIGLYKSATIKYEDTKEIKNISQILSSYSNPVYNYNITAYYDIFEKSMYNLKLKLYNNDPTNEIDVLISSFDGINKGFVRKK